MTLPGVVCLLPHEGEAVLLDELAELRDDGLAAWFTVRPGTVFSDPDGSLPSWALPELMAQAASAYGNLTSASPHSRNVGLLLAIRSCRIEAGAIAAGTRLWVDVVESTREDDGRAVFNCRIMRGESLVAEARLTALQPTDAWSVLEGQVS